MCGISCYYHFDHNIDCLPLDINASLDAIKSRGPDDRGVYTSPDRKCVLGHNRLSIVDLDSGHQPIVSKCSGICCVVNGELYNYESIRSDLESKGHIFSTKSDSEIALHLYEEYDLSFVDHLRGEFAICIWDENTRKMIAVRDRFGIKPLHYTVFNNTLLIASEIKAFMPLGWKAEWDITSLVHGKFFFGNRTCFKNVYKIPAGSYLVAEANGTIETVPYWTPEYPEKHVKESRSVEEMIQGVHDLLVDAIRQRLIADIPVGVYLSGGIDSSAIAGIASSILKEKNPEAKIRAFSISFLDGGVFDEGDIAKRTARFCNAEHEVISVTDNDVLNVIEEVIWHGEQPVNNFSTVCKSLLSKKAHEAGFKAVLVGEGADEIFGGYGFFAPEFLREPDLTMSGSFTELNESDRLKILGEREKVDMCFFNKDSTKNPKNSSKQRSIDDQMKKYDQTATFNNSEDLLSKEILNGVNVQSSLSKFFRFDATPFSSTVIQKYGISNAARSAAQSMNGITRMKIKNKWHPLHTALYVESTSFLTNYLCTIMGDRTEMMNSIEGRVPFLDHLLCEYVNGLPPSVKIKYEKNGELNEKWILKEATKSYITDELYKRTKRPFIAPSPKKTSKDIRNFINKFITKDNIERLGWANFESIDHVKGDFFKTGDACAFSHLLLMVSYVVISQRFGVATFKI